VIFSSITARTFLSFFFIFPPLEVGANYTISD